MNIKCDYCDKIFDKRPFAIKKSAHNFCSRKCSCAFGTEIRWKNYTTKTDKAKCEKCGLSCNYRSILCLDCYCEQKINRCKNITLKQLKLKHLNKKMRYWYSAEIRNFNRVWNKHLLDLPCQVCDYKNHIELCHIKSVKSFNDNALLGEINSEENNLVLCPNHHWEFDNGILLIKDIPRRKW
jgi:hypothetical protein